MTMITETRYVTGSSRTFLNGLSAIFTAMTAMMRFRMTLGVLAELDDHTLRDIGLTRTDLTELKTASSTDALKAITRIRFSR